ncbi:MAG TPA: class I SAM-dependent methyltransferase [Cyclobacteriaceae bacterium]
MAAGSLMTSSEYFRSHKEFEFQGGLYVQRDLPPSGFADQYLLLREQEGRLLPDALVSNLPSIPGDHPLYREWSVRKRSAERLVRYLKKKDVHAIMEIGCGNGWLTNYLCHALHADCCGIDITKNELEQAVRLFSRNGNPSFVYGDILSPAFDDCKADVMVLASVIQYFPDPPALLSKLIGRLNPGGEIHIMDSPVYREQEAASAKERSRKYFEHTGHTGMREHYHHHTWQSFQGHAYEIIHDPSSVAGWAKRLLVNASPFPWIRLGEGKDRAETKRNS